MIRQIRTCSFVFITILLFFPSQLIANDQIPTSAPMTTNLAGRGGDVAIPSVFRVIIPRLNRGGTAFFHKSGYAITVEHVVHACTPDDIELIDFRGQKYTVGEVRADENTDLSILKIKEDVKYALIEKAAASGFDTSKLIFVDHANLPNKANSADAKSRTTD